MASEHTVLVVEDNNFVRTQIVTFLKSAGYVVIEATNGNEALDMIGKNVTLAIVDVRMEPMGGFDFINMIQMDGYTLPVILVTGDQDSDLLATAGKLGVASVLMKPVQKDRLLTMAARLIERGAR